MLELELEHDQGVCDSNISFDFGGNLGSSKTVLVPVKSGRVAKRLVFLPRKVVATRFSPMQSVGQFTVSHFDLIRLAPWFAYDRLAQRLVNMSRHYRGRHKTEVVNLIRSSARDETQQWRLLLAHYDDTFVRLRSGRDYLDWIENVERLQRNVLQCESIPAGPLISLLLPTFNSDVSYLRDCIESVIRQSYRRWELCIADDCSSDPEVFSCLRSYVEKDNRIRLVERIENGHISAASNSALELASGEYVALLDHDDLLAPFALHCVVSEILVNPGAQLLYSDEDKVSESGERFEPHFKPAWNPDLLLSQNYICHLAVFSTSLVRRVGGFRLGFEGSQDHDLLLRCFPYLDSRNVVHIPRILYHWRSCNGSTAQSVEAKSYTGAAGLAGLRDLVKSSIPGAKAEMGRLPNTYRIRYPIPVPEPLVSLLIPTRDGYEILKPCLDAILERTSYPNFEVLILDNQSTCLKTLEYLERMSADPRVSVHRWNHSFNYSAINNFGATKARGELLALVNNDIEPINTEWLSEMVSHACRPEIGCVGAKLYYPNDTIQHGGVILGIGGVAGHAHKYFGRNDFGYFSRLNLVQNLSAVTGACLVIRKAVFDQVGGLESENLAIAFNDVDLCMRVREVGFRNLWTPFAELYHHESVSRGADDTLTKRLRAQKEAEYMRKQWGPKLDSDPAYNPNLTLIHEDFSLA